MQTLTLTPTAPFDLHLTASHQTYYQREFGADVYSDGVYHRAFEVDGKPCLGIVRSTGIADSPSLSVEVRGEGVTVEDASFVTQELSRMLSLEVELQPFYDTVKGDPFLGSAVEEMYGLHPPQTASPFEGLVMAIVGQQISGVVARSIRARVVRELGTPFQIDGYTAYTFPRPEAFIRAGLERLRALGLSARKAEYLLDVSARAAAGALSRGTLATLDNDQVARLLTAIRGVGEWTAQWVLLRALGRTDPFPSGDLALRRVISDLYFDGEPLDEKRAEGFARRRWSAYAGLATTYLFAYLRKQRVANEDREARRGV